jgi:hypothetical protein
MEFERPISRDRPRTSSDGRPRTSESRRSDFELEEDDEDDEDEFEDYIVTERPALWRAAMENNVTYVKEFIERVRSEYAGTGMPSVINWTDERGQTVLHLACLCKSYDTADMLLDEGADFYFPSDNGATPHVCLTDPVWRAALKQKAFDVSPEGILYWAQVLADLIRLLITSILENLSLTLLRRTNKDCGKGSTTDLYGQVSTTCISHFK